MWKDKPRGIKVASSNHLSKDERQRAHEEFLNSELKQRLDRSQAMLDNEWTVKEARKKVKASEVRVPKKVTITDDNCSWMITVTFEQFLKKGGKSKIVARFY